ncbi:MAG: DUF4189 domain-containing protein [Magnetococcus sp. DMHC-8]
MKKTVLWILITCLAAPGSAAAIGAIAIDDLQGSGKPAYGYALGRDSKREAKEAAIEYCEEYGGTHCQSVVWFETCGAVAVAKRRYGYGYGRTKAMAVADALEMCELNSCKVLVAECE